MTISIGAFRPSQNVESATGQRLAAGVAERNLPSNSIQGCDDAMTEILYDRDANPKWFVKPAQLFIRAIRLGFAEDVAATRAGTELSQVKIWMHQEGFIDAYKDAKTRKGTPRCVDLRGPRTDVEISAHRIVGPEAEVVRRRIGGDHA